MIAIDWTEVFETVKPLMLFIAGMAVYSIFIFEFYRFLATRDVFALNLQQYGHKKYSWLKKLISIILYITEYLLIFPLFVFLWFAVISVLLMVLARGQTADGILLISMALVATVRICSYYNESLSKDLAKMVPFALLAIFLLDINYFSWSASLEIVKGLPLLWETLLYYLVSIIGLEFILRIITFIFPKKDMLK